VGTDHWIAIQIQCCVQMHYLKNIQSDINYILKNTKLQIAAQALMNEPKHEWTK